ncbi:GNAT family N-acetyltransferase [Gilvimarinus sp. SDUM040013]|uniref:GNAT family N-acetyltransferase n=1 Tax=Gilvimarinus gilvus TaxID=3058038 RepID=A0ABU4S015_9GAMM|nr:GNAT family N-acetyltransferase [Gilvimarinus sp. SDUM040013]MDO3386089.1 GNAT family N-acetyltransferase [Gilvimarinus sp. SDUM040013]MDX6850370.1 GNAT family N-acetyltransferase [Gilvimarinus sp. SDUM040013]
MYTVRKAEQRDLDFMNNALFELNKMHHEAVPSEFKPPEEVDASKSLTRYITEDSCFAYVAEKAGEPIGFIAGHVKELLSPITKSRSMGSIDELFVAASHRREGIGSKLLAELESECKQRNATDVFVEIWEFNEKARQFYEAHGLCTRVRWAGKKL